MKRIIRFSVTFLVLLGFSCPIGRAQWVSLDLEKERTPQISYQSLKLIGDQLYFFSKDGVYSKNLATNATWQEPTFSGSSILNSVIHEEEAFALAFNGVEGSPTDCPISLLYSPNKGKTFKDITEEITSRLDLPKAPRQYFLMQNPQNEKELLLLIDDWDDIFLVSSSDFGKTWTPKVSIEEAHSDLSTLSGALLVPSNPKQLLLYGVSASYVGFISTINLDDFSVKNYELKKTDSNLENIIYHPSNPRSLFAFSGINNILVKSEDGGNTWTEKILEGGSMILLSTCIDYSSPSTLFLLATSSDKYEIYVSTDAGKTCQLFFTADAELGKLLDILCYKDRLILHSERKGLISVPLTGSNPIEKINTQKSELKVYMDSSGRQLRYETVANKSINRVELSDLSGQIVLRNFRESQSGTLDVSSLTPGGYILNIYFFNGQVASYKIQI
ncbi:T9SS type A sorting domain-containing protein [Porphyromonas crevioricanis]|nr:T9SS type A sorting domain-containing protein [Porphyromonas crevioricanis]